MALDEDVYGFDLFWGDSVVELVVFLVILDVLFKTVSDFGQYGLVDLDIVLFVLMVSLKHMIDRTLGQYLIVAFYLPQVT